MSDANLPSFLKYIANCKAITITNQEALQLRAAAALLEDAAQRHQETERLRLLLAWALAYVPEPAPGHANGRFAQRHLAAQTLTEGLMTT